MALEAAHYEETRKRLMGDPIVIAMAEELPVEMLREGMHDTDSPKFDLMMAANREYARRGGKDGGHIGAVAEAVIRLRIG